MPPPDIPSHSFGTSGLQYYQGSHASKKPFEAFPYQLVIIHITHSTPGQNCPADIQDCSGRHLGLLEIEGLTQKRPLTFEISYI